MTGYMCSHFRHDCSHKGCYLGQLPSWDDLLESFPRGIRPTDVDGMVEINGHVLFLEEKSAGVPVGAGQGRALRQLASRPDVTVVVFRPGVRSDLEVLIFDGSPPVGFQPRSRDWFKDWLHNWSEVADEQKAS